MNNIKNKIAIIIHGIIGGMDGRNGLGAPIDVETCAKLIKHNIIIPNNADVFCHSWSVNFENIIKDLYNPIKSLFQPQEFFNFQPREITDEPILGQPYRSISRFTSAERALNLKKDYEIENNFKYKWVGILRYDIVLLKKIDMYQLDPNLIHICNEPHWDRDHPNNTLLHDIIFISGSEIIDKLIFGFPLQLNQKIYDPTDIHHAVARKISSIFNNDTSKISRTFKRYEDLDIYRLVCNPGQNPHGRQYGALLTKNKMDELLKNIDKNNDKI